MSYRRQLHKKKIDKWFSQNHLVIFPFLEWISKTRLINRLLLHIDAAVGFSSTPKCTRAHLAAVVRSPGSAGHYPGLLKWGSNMIMRHYGKCTCSFMVQKERRRKESGRWSSHEKCVSSSGRANGSPTQHPGNYLRIAPSFSQAWLIDPERKREAEKNRGKRKSADVLRKRGRLETRWGSERQMLTFMTINERRKRAHLKISLVSHEIQVLKLVRCPEYVYCDP